MFKMKAFVVLASWLFGAAGVQTNPSQSNESEVRKVYDGWINPEDITPMPQCIAQQDSSAWLDAMTTCTAKRCTSWVIFCTHHQWLTQLSCLNTALSFDVVSGYLPYCSRSILAKKQLYDWVHQTTGRTWLAGIGDTEDVRHVSPKSLQRGYATMNMTDRAPSCLATGSSAGPLAAAGESFQRIMDSCSFTSSTLHIGNAARPWEYREGQKSMTALSYDTVGYSDLTGGYLLAHGEYFDRKCFCDNFALDYGRGEPCKDQGRLEVTKERLWMNATCGPTSLPDNWKDSLAIIGPGFISMMNWQWPKCVNDMPENITTTRANGCITEACVPDSNGYCERVDSAIDAACFCRNLTYNSYGDSCHVFETRIDYVNWLHGVCGAVPGWHGLPDNWRHDLANPTLQELFPWPWTVDIFGPPGLSKGWMLCMLVIVNLASVPPVLFTARRTDPRIYGNLS